MEKSVGSFLDCVKKGFSLEKKEAKQYSPLTLAYLGDGVYDLIIRTLLVEQANQPVKALHRKASAIVKAQSQARLLHEITELLTEEELSVYKRGRNAKSATSAKNASIGDYRVATGLEALFGYLYLENRMERAVALVRQGLIRLGEWKEKENEV
jgi:ribonuclease-3 family protein